MATRNIEGEKITLGGEEYLLPPLPLVKVPKVRKLLGGGDPTVDDGYVESVVDAIYWSLVRNYPDMNRDVVADNLDMTNMQQVLGAFMAANQLGKVQPGEV